MPTCGIVPRTQSHSINDFWGLDFHSPIIHSYIDCDLLSSLRGIGLLSCKVHFVFYVSFGFSAMCHYSFVHSLIYLTTSNLFVVRVLLLGTPSSLSFHDTSFTQFSCSLFDCSFSVSHLGVSFSVSLLMWYVRVILYSTLLYTFFLFSLRDLNYYVYTHVSNLTFLAVISFSWAIGS